MITWCVSSELIHTRTSDRVVPLVAVNALNSLNRFPQSILSCNETGRLLRFITVSIWRMVAAIVFSMRLRSYFGKPVRLPCSFNIVNFFRDRFHYIAFEFVFTHSTGLIFLPIRAANIAILIALSLYFFLAND